MLTPRALPQRLTSGGGPSTSPSGSPSAGAYFEAGQEDQAAPWFQQIVDSTTERVWWPIPYVRSFYFLGKGVSMKNQGDMEKAFECLSALLRVLERRRHGPGAGGGSKKEVSVMIGRGERNRKNRPWNGQISYRVSLGKSRQTKEVCDANSFCRLQSEGRSEV